MLDINEEVRTVDHYGYCRKYLVRGYNEDKKIIKGLGIKSKLYTRAQAIEAMERARQSQEYAEMVKEFPEFEPERSIKHGTLTFSIPSDNTTVKLYVKVYPGGQIRRNSTFTSQWSSSGQLYRVSSPKPVNVPDDIVKSLELTYIQSIHYAMMYALGVVKRYKNEK